MVQPSLMIQADNNNIDIYMYTYLSIRVENEMKASSPFVQHLQNGMLVL